MVIRQTFDRPLVLADAFAGHWWRGLDWRPVTTNRQVLADGARESGSVNGVTGN